MLVERLHLLHCCCLLGVIFKDAEIFFIARLEGLGLFLKVRKGLIILRDGFGRLSCVFCYSVFGAGMARGE